MIKHIHYLAVLVLLLCVTLSPVFAQTFSIDGELRPRMEFRDGFKKPLADSLNTEALVLQRSRLTADYTSNSLNFHITLQDARVWGQEDTKSSTSKVSIFEAWAEMLLTSGFSMQLGRQALSYDDQRLVSVGNWSNTGTSHDALLFKYKETDLQVHLGFAYNNTNDTLFQYPYSIKGMYQTLGLFWLSKKLMPGLNLTLISLDEGLQKTTTPKPTVGRFTSGGNLTYQNDSSAFGGVLTFYEQRGRDANFKTLHAYLLALKAIYKVHPLVPLQLGIDKYSGSAFDADTTASFTFNKLYGLNHSFNGSMEYWAALPTGGLTDYYAGISYKPDLWTINCIGHLFYLSNEMKDKYQHIMDKNLGSELDLNVNYQWSKEVAIQGGWSMYFPSSTTRQVNGLFNAQKQLLDIKRPQWIYMMLAIKPNLFKYSQPGQ